ncbi:MAG TPA: hypothetical protein VGE35_02305 [Candidatus Paceibacterota bacterium]
MAKTRTVTPFPTNPFVLLVPYKLEHPNGSKATLLSGTFIFCVNGPAKLDSMGRTLVTFTAYGSAEQLELTREQFGPLPSYVAISRESGKYMSGDVFQVVPKMTHPKGQIVVIDPEVGHIALSLDSVYPVDGPTHSLAQYAS